MFALQSVVFLSAFLLFAVEPLICKHILPWFGGVPAVWSTCLVFFQLMLLGGYAYAHWIARRADGRRAALVHAALLGASVVALVALACLWSSPVTPGVALRPPDSEHPIPRILGILSLSVGLPFFLLSSTSPLLQHWYSRLGGTSPYRLYALSNAGSLLALLCYPFLIEPSLSISRQGWCWSAGFLLFAVGCALVALRVNRSVSAIAPEPAAQRSATDRPWRWVLLSAFASVLLLATTTQMLQDVAGIPLLWVLPLALYLLSLILCFEGGGWYLRPLWFSLYGLSLMLVTALILGTSWHWLLDLRAQFAVYLAALFSGCMILHGELVRLRPGEGQLTRFYLFVSLGGALGGCFVGLAAPQLFKGYWEFPLAQAGCCVTIAAVLVGSLARQNGKRGLQLALGSAAALSVALASVLALSYRIQSLQAKASTRGFFGVLRVLEFYIGEPEEFFALKNGSTLHGYEFTAPALRMEPVAEFTNDSGVGLAIKTLHARLPDRGLKIGILGEGVGAITALLRPGDQVRIYEINPQVIQFAGGQGGYFHFLEGLSPPAEVVEGDARIALERELALGQRHDYDLLAVDTFNGDAIPVHMLTEDAMAVYLQQLRPGGILAVHAGNAYLDIPRVVLGSADHFGLHAVQIFSEGKKMKSFGAHWLLLSSDQGLLDAELLAQAPGRTPLTPPDQRVTWTDERSDVFSVFRKDL
jgi:hypothetical protein